MKSTNRKELLIATNLNIITEVYEDGKLVEMFIDPHDLKLKLNNDTIRFYVENDITEGKVTFAVGRVKREEWGLYRSPLTFTQPLPKGSTLNDFLEKYKVGTKSLIKGIPHTIKAIDIDITEDDLNQRINTSKFIAKVYFNAEGDTDNDYRYI